MLCNLATQTCPQSCPSLISQLRRPTTCRPLCIKAPSFTRLISSRINKQWAIRWDMQRIQSMVSLSLSLGFLIRTNFSIAGAPYQNFWPQPMTYFLPQAAGASAPVLVPPGPPQTPNATLIQSAPSTNSHNPSTNSNAAGRRNSPPSNNHSNNSNNNSTPGPSLHTTALPLQTFSSSVPLSDNTQGSGPQALYALPPSVYPNVLPYSTPTAGFYQPLPHHPQANATIISSVIPNHHQAGTLPSTPHSFQSNAGPMHSGDVQTHFTFNQSTHNANNNSASTPQSAPSTPLSLTNVQPSFKNPPLFATPPVLTTQAPMHVTHYEEKKHYSSYVPKKFHNNNGSGILSTPPSLPPHNAAKPSSNNISQRPSGYQASVPAKKNLSYAASNNINNTNANNNSTNNHTHSEDSLSNSNNYASNRLKNSSTRDQTSAGSTASGGSYQPKPTYVPKQQQQPHQPHQSYSANNNGSNSNSPNSNDNSEGSGGSKYVPQQHRGPSRIVPPSLELKRNNSNSNVMTNSYHHHRSTPSTNSTESNNSPNSITSFDHSRSYHYAQYPASSGAPHFYRGGSAGAINAGVQVTTNANNNPGDGTSIQTCFPFNVHSQNAGASAPLLDSCHHQLIGYNNPMGGGMYVKFGQAFTFANVRTASGFDVDRWN